MTVFAFHSWAKKDLRSENIFHDVFVLNCWDLCILLVRGLLGGAGRLGRVVYEQFFYDDLVPTILPCTIYSHTMFPAPTNAVIAVNYTHIRVMHSKHFVYNVVGRSIKRNKFRIRINKIVVFHLAARLCIRKRNLKNEIAFFLQFHQLY